MTEVGVRITQKDSTKSFDLRDRRLMLSLGALTSRTYCTFSCKFCYLRSPNFESYKSADVAEIVADAASAVEEYDCVYISGDTDSFAPPRTAVAVELVEGLSELNKDVLFTTRADISDDLVSRLGRAASRLQEDGRMLIGCVSITQLTRPDLEPPPIPNPETRGDLLRRLKEAGLVTVLAVRPFLPTVDPNDYEQIVRRWARWSDAVLGSTWFADPDGELEAAVGIEVDSAAVSGWRTTPTTMDFDANNALWTEFRNDAIADRVEAECMRVGRPFFMRSAPALRHLRGLAAG